jgi:hypothetical protein
MIDDDDDDDDDKLWRLNEITVGQDRSIFQRICRFEHSTLRSEKHGFQFHFTSAELHVSVILKHCNFFF